MGTHGFTVFTLNLPALQHLTEVIFGDCVCANVSKAAHGWLSCCELSLLLQLLVVRFYPLFYFYWVCATVSMHCVMAEPQEPLACQVLWLAGVLLCLCSAAVTAANTLSQHSFHSSLRVA